MNEQTLADTNPKLHDVVEELKRNLGNSDSREDRMFYNTEALVFFLCHEYLKGKDSPWYRYLQSLPKVTGQDFSLIWFVMRSHLCLQWCQRPLSRPALVCYHTPGGRGLTGLTWLTRSMRSLPSPSQMAGTAGIGATRRRRS